MKWQILVTAQRFALADSACEQKKLEATLREMLAVGTAESTAPVIGVRPFAPSS
jgi:hypothetical protein